MIALNLSDRCLKERWWFARFQGLYFEVKKNCRKEIISGEILGIIFDVKNELW